MPQDRSPTTWRDRLPAVLQGSGIYWLLPLILALVLLAALLAALASTEPLAPALYPVL
jgi:hypothetical protein